MNTDIKLPWMDWKRKPENSSESVNQMVNALLVEYNKRPYKGKVGKQKFDAFLVGGIFDNNRMLDEIKFDQWPAGKYFRELLANTDESKRDEVLKSLLVRIAQSKFWTKVQIMNTLSWTSKQIRVTAWLRS